MWGREAQKNGRTDGEREAHKSTVFQLYWIVDELNAILPSFEEIQYLNVYLYITQ